MNQFSDYFKTTFCLQRKFLNKFDPDLPSMRQVKEAWPILLTKEGLDLHLNMLVGINKQTVIEKPIQLQCSIPSFIWRTVQYA